MTDLPDDTPDTDDMAEPTERLPVLPSLDSFKAVRDLVALAIDPRAVKRNLRSLHDALAATTAARHELESARAAHDAQVAKDRAEFAADRAKLREGETALANKREWREDNLLERERRISALEAAWKSLKLPGEDNFVTFGGLTREPPRVTGLQKAKFFEKHGRLPHVDESLDAPVATSEPRPEQSRTVIVGRDGTTLSQTVTESEAAPVGAARVRPRRGAAHAE
jgi:hypothetical protein